MVFIHPKDLLDQLPLFLTDGIAGVTRRPAVNRAMELWRDVGRDPQIAHGGDKAGYVEALVPADGPARRRADVEQQLGRRAFGGPPGGRDADVRDQPMPIVEQDLPPLGPPRFFSPACSRRPPLGIPRPLLGALPPRL